MPKVAHDVELCLIADNRIGENDPGLPGQCNAVPGESLNKIDIILGPSKMRHAVDGDANPA